MNLSIVTIIAISDWKTIHGFPFNLLNVERDTVLS